MDDNRINLNGFKKNNVARDAVADVGVGRIHEAAAVFDDEGRAAELQDIRQRFQQRFGFGDEVLHGLIPSRKPGEGKRVSSRQFHFHRRGNLPKLPPSCLKLPSS